MTTEAPTNSQLSGQPDVHLFHDQWAGFADRLVSEIMSRSPLTADRDESAARASNKLRRSGFRHLPVITLNGRCLGVLEARDLDAGRAMADGLRPDGVDLLLLGRRIVHLVPEDTIRTAVETMVVNKTTALPVTDESGRLVGLVCASDVLCALANQP